MTTTAAARSDAPPPLGHNNPPEPTLVERLAANHDEALRTVEAIAARANSAPEKIESDLVLASVGEVAAEAARAWKELDAERSREKEPFLKAGREVDAFFKPALDRLDRIKRALTDRVNVYQRAKAAEARRRQQEAEAEARRKAEEARRQAEEAAKHGRADDALAALEDAAAAEREAREAVAATPTAAESTRLRTASGTTITTRTTMAFEVEDYDAIPLDKLRPYLDRAAIDKALRAYLKVAKGSAKLPGVRFFEEEAAQFRG